MEEGHGNATVFKIDIKSLVPALAIMSCIVLSGVFGNVLVLAAIYTSKGLRTTSNFFIACLSVCDLIVVSAVVPINMYTVYCAAIGDPCNMNNWCDGVAFISYLLTGAALMNIVYIAWNRYNIITRFQQYHIIYTDLNIISMFVSVWVTPALVLLPPLLGAWGKFGYESQMMRCDLLMARGDITFKIFLLVSRVVVPGCLVLYCYVHVYGESTRHGRLALASHRAQRRELRLTRMMLCVFIGFVVTYVPCTTTGIVDFLSYGTMSPVYHVYCSITIYIGSIINPVLYGLMNKQFRSAYGTILTCGRYDLAKKARMSSTSLTTLHHSLVAVQSVNLSTTAQ